MVGNLHSLEFALRAFLHKQNADEPQANHQDFRVGGLVPENSFTNYDSLGGLIEKFNAVVELTFRVALDLVALRDMLAHGRIASKSEGLFPMELVKFGKPKNKMVSVEAVAIMDAEWFKTKINLVYQQILKVVKASQSRGWNEIGEPASM